MDNEYLNGWAKYFGAIGTAIYVSLCRHADNETQTCFPSQETIAAELGISTRTVKKYINLFQKYNVIGVLRERDYTTKMWKTNVYRLLDKCHWSKPGESVAHGKPRADKSKSQGQRLPNNKTHTNNNTQTLAAPAADQEKTGVDPKETSELINTFKSNNPSFDRMFGNKTERAAAERMIIQHGYERMIRVAKFAVSVSGKSYAPVITTPYQLEKNMGKLVAYFKREGSSKKMMVEI